MNSVSGLLRLLDAMPATEPPADLTLRTMQRIEQRVSYGAPAQPSSSTSAPIHPSAQLEPRPPE